jgi:predicted Zn-dependent protease
MSKQILASVGLGVAVLANPDLEDWAFLGEVGLGLVFLKYSRDDERQADDLGLRYSVRTGYDPHQMPEVFRMLDAVSKVEGAGRLPNWLSTHPDSGVRAKRIEQEVAALDGDFSNAKVERDSYLQRLDGMVFGDNPREGYFQGNAFLHPDLRFRIDFPEGWETSNQKDAVTAADPGGKAMVQVSTSEKDTRDDAQEAFFSEAGVTEGKSWEKKVHGLPASWNRFEFKDEDSDLRGTVAFVEHGESIFQVMALSDTASWNDLQETLEDTIASFSRLDDPKALQTRPYKMKVVRLDSDMTVESFMKRYPSDVPVETVALINHVQPDGTLKKGQIAKRVVAAP